MAIKWLFYGDFMVILVGITGLLMEFSGINGGCLIANYRHLFHL
jgi:hypothetical protein